MSRARIGVYILLSAVISLLLGACGPSIPRTQAEHEVADTMLDYLVSQQVGGSPSYRRMPAQPWSNAPYEAGILVWAPANQNFREQGIDYLETEKPLQVWWLADAALTPVASDMRLAVEDYRSTRITHRPADAKWGWNYTEFGILSMSNGNRQAKVYVGISCGPLCGTGTIYTLQRDDSGKWTMTDEQGVWIS